MDRPAEAVQRGSLSDYLAAERTLLAWIRTGLALMGFGFVLARFALFMQELHVMQSALLGESYGSLWFGTALIAAGVFVNVFAGWRHLRLVQSLNRGEKLYHQPTIQTVAIAFFLAAAGLAMAIYLVSLKGSFQPQHGTQQGEIIYVEPELQPAARNSGVKYGS